MTKKSIDNLDKELHERLVEGYQELMANMAAADAPDLDILKEVRGYLKDRGLLKQKMATPKARDAEGALQHAVAGVDEGFPSFGDD